MVGTKLFLLSTTATSTVTRLVSAEKVAAGGAISSLDFGASFDGIFGSSPEVEAGAGAETAGAGADDAGGTGDEDDAGADESAAGFLGRATVSLPTGPGPSCAKRAASRTSRNANATIGLF